MAELNQHDEIAGGVDRGAFQAVMNAMASRDPNLQVVKRSLKAQKRSRHFS